MSEEEKTTNQEGNRSTEQATVQNKSLEELSQIQNDRILVEFQSITQNENTEECLKVLRSTNWDLQRALLVHFQSSPTTTASAPPTIPTSQVRSRNTNATTSTSSSTRQNPSNQRNPQIVRQPQPYRTFFSQLSQHIPAPLLNITTFFFRFFGVFSRFIPSPLRSAVTALFSIVFSSSLSISTTSSQDSSIPEHERFIKDFESKFGQSHPQFFRGSFENALSNAKNNYKFLIAYFHSREHYNTNTFCRSVFGNSAIIDYINNNYVIWGADVSFRRAYELQHRLNVCDFPTLMILNVDSVSRPTLIGRIEGLKSANEILQSLTDIINNQGVLLVAARLENEERERERQLRTEQEEEYQRAIAEQTFREQQEQEEEERKKREEEELKRQEQEQQEKIRKEQELAEQQRKSREQERELRRQNLPAEPQGPNTFTIAFKTPNGRVIRKFLDTDTVQTVKEFADAMVVDSSYKSINDYNLVTSFPRKVLNDLSLTLTDAGLSTQTAIIIEEVFLDEETK